VRADLDHNHEIPFAFPAIASRTLRIAGISAFFTRLCRRNVQSAAGKSNRSTTATCFTSSFGLNWLLRSHLAASDLNRAIRDKPRSRSCWSVVPLPVCQNAQAEN